MDDVPGMSRGIRDYDALSGCAVYDFSIADIDHHMAVLGFRPLACAEDIAGNSVAGAGTDIHTSGVASGVIAPLIGVDKVVEKASWSSWERWLWGSVPFWLEA